MLNTVSEGCSLTAISGITARICIDGLPAIS